jgi:hypothetical protein
MRCPSCGTENAPDSRFCGGCGTRVAMSGSRVAPTQKIADDASFPQHQIGGSAVPVTAPGVVPARPIPAAPFLPPSPPAVHPPFGVNTASPARPITAPPILPVAPPMAQAAARPFAPELYAVSAPPDPRSAPRPQIASVDDASRSLPIQARRPWGLMLAVLAIDVGLAVAGAWMLHQGLADRPGRAAPTASDSPPPVQR